MIRFILFLVGFIVLGLTFWFGLARIPWFQERYSLLLISRLVLCLPIMFIVIMMVWTLSLSRELTPALSDPEITYGEFPFRLEYEIDGEHFVIEDTLIAEFLESMPGTTFGPPSRRWRTTLQNAGEELRFLLMETDDVTIHFTAGRSRYFMSDRAAYDATNIPNPAISAQPEIVITRRGENRLFERIYKDSEDAHEMLAAHGITLISWEYTPPIVNRFNN